MLFLLGDRLCLLDEQVTDLIDNAIDPNIDWKYKGRFLQIGELVYKNPKTGDIHVVVV